MIEIGLTLAAILLLIAAIMIIKGLRDRAERDRHRQLEKQANIQRKLHREQRERDRARAAENRAKTADKPTVFDLRDNAKGYTPRHQRRDTYPRRVPGTDMGITTNPALLYGATGDTSTTSTTGDCGSSGSSGSSSSSSSYDGGSSSSCDSGGGSF